MIDEVTERVLDELNDALCHLHRAKMLQHCQRFGRFTDKQLLQFHFLTADIHSTLNAVVQNVARDQAILKAAWSNAAAGQNDDDK